MHGGQRARFPVSMGGLAARTCPVEPARWTGCMRPVEPAGGLLARASRRACTADFLRSSHLIKQLHARHRVWLNFDTVNIIQPFAILKCQLFVSKRTSLATNVCASSQTGRFFYHGIYVPCHETMPSFMFFG